MIKDVQVIFKDSKGLKGQKSASLRYILLLRLLKFISQKAD